MANEVTQDAIELSPCDPAQGVTLGAARGAYLFEAPAAGTMPLPGSLKEMAAGAVKSLFGQDMAVLLDALGARLQFERTGARIYEALLTKARALDPVDGGPTEAALVEIYNDELAHFQLLQDTITALGADPTAVTPTANVQAVATMGVLQVVSDPRLGMRETMQASLLIELVDKDSWHLLVRVAEALGQEQLAARFRVALDVEEQHVVRVRGWLTAMTENLASGDAARAAAE
jgi:rubrerythrin